MPTSSLSAWSVSALLAGTCIAGHYLSLKAASGKLGDAFGAFILEAVAAIGILVLWFFQKGSDVPTTTRGVVWACVSGLFISGATTLLFRSLRLGGPVSATGPIVLGGGVALSALVAPFLFQESFTIRRALGVVLALCAIGLLATE